MVELMITVVIIGIIVGASVPAVLEYRTERQGLNAARDLTQQFRALRHLAATTNRALIVTVTQGDGGGGAQKGGVTVLQSADNRCRVADSVVRPELGLNFNQLYPSDNLQVVKVSPGPTPSFCMKPDGRVLAMGGNVARSTPLLPDESSAQACTGDGYVEAGSTKLWPNYCNKPGVLCMKVAYLNPKCPSPCQRISDGCVSHLGVDHIVTVSYTGESRMVQ